jgi:hypothetical protein
LGSIKCHIFLQIFMNCFMLHEVNMSQKFYFLNILIGIVIVLIFLQKEKHSGMICCQITYVLLFRFFISFSYAPKKREIVRILGSDGHSSQISRARNAKKKQKQ